MNIPRPRPSRILGPNGKPAASFLYPSPRYNLRQYKPRYWLAADTKTNFSEYDRWEAVNYSRQLFAQVGDLSTAIKQKNSWAYGDAWDPHYFGRNAKWAEEAREFLVNQFYPMCNLRGPQYDLKTSLRISGQLWDVDGDDLMVLTQNENGFPQIAFFPSTRIGETAIGPRGPMQSQRDGNQVKGGAFEGAKIFDGVIMDRNDRMIAVRVANPDGTVQDISGFNCDLAYLPDWHDQGRGIPRVIFCLLRWMNRQDIDEFLLRGMKRAASIGLKFKKAEGEAGLGNEIITAEDDLQAAALPNGTTLASGGDSPKIYYEEIEGGEMYYLNSGSGEEIEALDYENPHPNSEAFIERITRECVASAGWLYELLDLSKSGRAPTRLACDIGNQSIWDQQRPGVRRWRRAITYAIAKAMKEGFISKNNDGIDPYMWEPGFPKQLTVDQGNDEQADRENLKMGTTSKTIIAQKKGYHRDEIRRQRMQELKDLMADARELMQGNPELSFERAMDLLEQRQPNLGPSPSPDLEGKDEEENEPTAAPPPKKKKKK